ncbi:MAG: hypothetical protein MPN21_06345 [Thermoanaerobaculia bacterium]|nr:hypothetical protein [Thermoanaerobaculia bacterium]
MFGRCVVRYLVGSVGIAVWLVASGATEAQEIETTPVVVDRLVAVVDDDPIFLSDVDRVLALGLVTASSAADGVERRRIALDRLIEERLRLHEVERYELAAVPSVDVDRQLALLSESLGGDGALQRQLGSQDMDIAALRLLLRRQLRILAYVEERLGPRVSVTEEQVERYYEGEFRSEMAARGTTLPPLVEVTGAIQTVLREQALNREIEDWTDDLRRRADVVDLLSRRRRDLPPVVFRQ